MSLYFRLVEKKDCDLLYEWVNDKEVRKNAFNDKIIDYKEHCRWFENILVDYNVIQLIYMCEDEPIGQVRLIKNKECAEIDFSIKKEKRSMGYGKQMILLLFDFVKENYPEIKTLMAKVKPYNMASKSAFISAGYKKIYEEFEINL